MDLTGSHNLLSLSGTTLTIKTEDEALIGTHIYRVQAYLKDHEAIGYFEPYNDITIVVEPEIVVEVDVSVCSGSTVV